MQTVRKNARGGVLVRGSDLAGLMELVDRNRKGFITASDVQQVGNVFFPDMSDKDVRLMMNRKDRITEEYLAELLCDNEQVGYDPVEDAFRTLAAGGDALDLQQFRAVLLKLGAKFIACQDLEFLLASADQDGDGKIG